MRAAPLLIADSDRAQLEKWVRSTTTKAGLVQRARIVLLAADGVAHAEIARRFSISRQTVINWRARYEEFGVDGLFDEERSGRPRTLDRKNLIAVTLTPPPAKYGVTHWSSRLLAEHLKIGHATVARVWREHGVQPWRSETFKFSTDPELVAKVTDIVGLYLEPPENAIVLCVDEKSQIQALDRTDTADADRDTRTTNPRLRPQRHDDTVRSPRGRHRTGHRDLPATAPSPGISGVPQTRREGIPGPAIAPGDGQLRHPQEAGSP